MSKFIRKLIPKGYTIKLCGACYHNYNGPDCCRCWNLAAESDGDYWIDKNTPPTVPFNIEPLTESSILQMRVEHLEMELINMKQEFRDIIKRKFEDLL